MATSTLEPFTILASESTDTGEENCGCGCGCGASLTQLALPPDTLDGEKAQPTQS
jgi:hypothetical protein